MYKEKIVNAITGEITWRDYTAEEIAAVEAAKAQEAINTQEKMQMQIKRQALLEKLGITEEEARLLLL